MKADPSIPLITLRELPIIIDADLAKLYGVQTRALNQAIRRNMERFPEDFMFQLTTQEKAEVITNCDHLQNLKFSKSLPYAFTEHGALMAANVLNSKDAISMSVFIIRAFVSMREALITDLSIQKRLATVEKTLMEHDQSLWDVYQKLLPLLQPPADNPKPRIGFG